jgi:hypothetical protein
MKPGKLLTLVLVVASVNVGDAAWEKVPVPEGVNEMILWMEFSNPNLGYASIRELIWAENFLIYRDGRWRLTRLGGMFQGCATKISLLPNGYGWLCGRHGGLYRLFYTARTWGNGGWDEVENPYSKPPGYEGTPVAMSVAAEEDVWFIFDGPYRILRYKEGVWEIKPYDLPAELGTPYNLFFVSAEEAWASGKNGFAHYKNGEWRYVPGPPASGLEFTAPDDGWATYYEAGQILHYNGTSWNVSFTIPGRRAFWISFYDRNNGWADLYKSEAKPVHRIFKYESGAWREVTPPGEYGIWMPCSVSPNEAWFLGSEDNKYITWHWYTEPNVEPTSLGKIKTLFK